MSGKDIGPAIWLLLVIAFFLAGFALADVLLFGGETMPDFIKQNPKPKG